MEDVKILFADRYVNNTDDKNFLRGTHHAVGAGVRWFVKIDVVRWDSKFDQFR